jgi:hypothetical protein
MFLFADFFGRRQTRTKIASNPIAHAAVTIIATANPVLANEPPVVAAVWQFAPVAIADLLLYALDPYPLQL